MRIQFRAEDARKGVGGWRWELELGKLLFGKNLF